MRNSSYCVGHDPGQAEARRQRAAKGGRRGGRGRPQTELTDLKADVRAIIEDVRTGRLDKGVGAVLGQLYNVLLKAVSTELAVKEQLELVERMDAIEEALQARRKGWYGA